MKVSEVRFDPELRPRLLPAAVLLRRSDDELQIGLDPAWQLRDHAGRWHQILSRLDGRRSWRQISAELRSGEAADLARLLESLAAAGLAVLGPGGHRPAPLGRVRLVGSGELAASISARLAGCGIKQHRIQPGLEPYGRRPRSWAVDLTLIVADTLEADRGVAARLQRHDAAHLVVRPRPSTTVIGPLVVPGRTACLHCTDLTRRDADPAWPRLLGQLEQTATGQGPGSVVDWTVGFTVTQVLGYLVGEWPQTCGATLELSVPRYTMAWRAWTPHPECGCRWPGSVGAA